MACKIVFFGPSTDVLLDLDADEVGKRLGDASAFERFEQKNGKIVWINPRNVLWIESRDKPQSPQSS